MCISEGVNFSAVQTHTSISSLRFTSARTETVHLQTVDSVEATIVVDNSIDILMSSSEKVTRPPLTWDWSSRPPLRAEHGYSLLLTVRKKGETRSILYDAGLGPDTILHNLSVLGISLKELDGIVLSHGHADHHGGLLGIVHSLGRKNVPFVLHPDAWKERKLTFPNGAEMYMPPPDRRTLEKIGVQIVDSSGPTFLINDQALVTGRVERTTSYEKGFAYQMEAKGSGWEPDPWIWDDQGIIFNINGKGLVVASSCSHSGVVNVLRNAQRLTGVQKIHAFIGGLHLTGGLSEKIIPQTIDDVMSLNPDMIVPGHCTGWKATHMLSQKLPNAFVQPSVGTRVTFG